MSIRTRSGVERKNSAELRPRKKGLSPTPGKILFAMFEPVSEHPPHGTKNARNNCNDRRLRLRRVQYFIIRVIRPDRSGYQDRRSGCDRAADPAFGSFSGSDLRIIRRNVSGRDSTGSCDSWSSTHKIGPFHFRTLRLRPGCLREHDRHKVSRNRTKSGKLARGKVSVRVRRFRRNTLEYRRQSRHI